MNLSREVKIGIVVVMAIAMFVFGYNFLKGRNIFTPQRVFYGVYDNINGLLESNPVNLNGYKVGQVLKTTLRTDGKILVEISINNGDFKIPSNSVAKIYSTDFLGAKAIELELGNAAEYLDNKDTLLTDVEVSFIDDVGGEVVAIKKQAENLISSIDSVVVSVKEVFNKKTRNNLISSFESITIISKSLEKTTKSVENYTSPEGNFTLLLGNIESISNNLKSNNKTLTKIIKNFDQISDSVAKANITTTISNLNSTLSQASMVMEKINKGEGSAGLLFKDDSLYKNLSSASLDLDKLLLDVQKNPGRYFHFSVFGKKDKSEQTQ